MRCGNQENVIVFLKHKEKKMPRSKKAVRKTTRRKDVDRRRKSNPADIFWTKVINGFKKFLESPFK